MQMNWLWPRRAHEEATFAIRTGRVLHWSFVGLAILFSTVSVVGAAQEGGAEPVFYVTLILIWFGFALLGRGLRYLLARE